MFVSTPIAKGALLCSTKKFTLRTIRPTARRACWLVFVAGVAVGAAVGILLAPNKGADTRRLIARQAEETRDQVVKAVEGVTHGAKRPQRKRGPSLRSSPSLRHFPPLGSVLTNRGGFLMTLVGSGAFTYAVQQDWFELPEGWSFGWVPAVACDSTDRVYVYSRSGASHDRLRPRRALRDLVGRRGGSRTRTASLSTTATKSGALSAKPTACASSPATASC